MHCSKHVMEIMLQCRFSNLHVFFLSSADNFPQMAHQKRFIERKYRQELKEMRRERERQERDSDEG